MASSIVEVHEALFVQTRIPQLSIEALHEHILDRFSGLHES